MFCRGGHLWVVPWGSLVADREYASAINFVSKVLKGDRRKGEKGWVFVVACLFSPFND